MCLTTIFLYNCMKSAVFNVWKSYMCNDLFDLVKHFIYITFVIQVSVYSFLAFVLMF